MPPNILLTGASGYLGGTLFHHLSHLPSPLPAHGKIYALVRTDEQAERVKSLYNAEPLTLDLSNTESITTTLLTHEISIVFWLIDAGSAEKQLRIIDALGEVGSKLGVQTHFLHTTGAKLFSNFAGPPTEGDLGDSEEGLYELLKEARGWFEGFNVVRTTTLPDSVWLLNVLMVCAVAESRLGRRMCKSLMRQRRRACGAISSSPASSTARAQASAIKSPSKP